MYDIIITDVINYWHYLLLDQWVEVSVSEEIAQIEIAIVRLFYLRIMTLFFSWCVSTFYPTVVRLQLPNPMLGNSFLTLLLLLFLR